MLEVSGICRSYRRQVILEGVELTVGPGDCVGIVGHNGYGETTLLSIVPGALRVDKGSVVFNDRQAVGRPRVLAEEAVYVPQENPLMEEPTVRDNLFLWYRGSRKGMEEDPKNEAAAILGVNKILNHMAGKLPGGMKKGVSTVCALSNYTPMLITDEPGAALGLEYEELIRNYLQRYMTGGGVVMLTFHELAELVLCVQIHMLRQGRLIKIENGLLANELISQFRQKYNRARRMCMGPM